MHRWRTTVTLKVASDRFAPGSTYSRYERPSRRQAHLGPTSFSMLMRTYSPAPKTVAGHSGPKNTKMKVGFVIDCCDA